MKRARPPSPAYLSITAKHSFLQVKRLPRRSRKVPGVVVMGGGVCLHSISSIGNGAGRIFRVAPCVRTGLCLVQMDGSGWSCQTPHRTGMKYRGCRRTRPERRLATVLPTRWDGCEAMEAELSRAGPGSLWTEIAARAFRCWQDAIEEHAAEDAGVGVC